MLFVLYLAYQETLIFPTDMSVIIDAGSMVAGWKAEFNHDVDIRVCGTCNLRDITDGEYKQIPIT